MRCIGCGSTAVSERSERTTQGMRLPLINSGTFVAGLGSG
jgi:hypothetical protein